MTSRVATREGGVDRNYGDIVATEGWRVATREGGVDRNKLTPMDIKLTDASPPARVAWIETLIYLATAIVYSGRHPRGWRG